MHCAYRCPTDVPLLHVGPIVHARCNALNTLIIPNPPRASLRLRPWTFPAQVANGTRSQRVSVAGQHRARRGPHAQGLRHWKKGAEPHRAP